MWELGASDPWGHPCGSLEQDLEIANFSAKIKKKSHYSAFLFSLPLHVSNSSNKMFKLRGKKRPFLQLVMLTFTRCSVCMFNISISFMKGVGGRNVFLYFVFNLVCNYLIYWKVQKVLNTVSYIWNLRNKSRVLTVLKRS